MSTVKGQKNKQPPYNLRVICATTLARVTRDGKSLTAALVDNVDAVEPRDRGLFRELCFGVARFAPAYDRLLKKLLAKAIKPSESEVKMLLYVGIYQLDQTRIPDHAAINSVVDATKVLKKPWATGLVNGVLRRYLRERAALQSSLAGDLCYRFAHPQWFIDQLRSAWPKRWQAILEANNTHPPMTLRVNARHSTRENYSALLSTQAASQTDQANQTASQAELLPADDLVRAPAEKISGEPSEQPAHYRAEVFGAEVFGAEVFSTGAFSPVAIQLNQACDVTALPHFAEGWVSVQDEAAQLSAELLELAPGQRVLDACCAPGGKSCHIAEHQPELAELVAIDVDATRLQRVQENITRLVDPANITLKTADASQLDAWWDGEGFDRILLDAPCSATGVIRRHPDIKLLRRPTDIAQLAELQQLLLSRLWQTLKPGGMMLYATCSVLPRENERSIEAFLADTPDAESVPISGVNWGEARPNGRQLFPSPNGHDGFYYCKLHKQEK